MVVTVGLEPTSVRSIVVQTPWSGVCTRFALTNSRRFLLRRTAHRADASLVCPIDVNDVLYRLSHATTISYLWPTSPVGHLEQFVLTTEPRDHEIACEGTGKSCPCGRAERPEAGRTSAEPIHPSVFRILRRNV